MAKTKIVYQISAAGEFLGPTEAEESPLEPGVWHMPRLCVETAPPDDVPADKWPRWNGAEWELIYRPAAVEVGPVQVTPLDKLKSFLAQNPDVSALLS